MTFTNHHNKYFSGGTFGLERETLRVNLDATLSKTPHPVNGDSHIVKDFCENQIEINTDVHNTAQGAVNELAEQSNRLKELLNSRKEILWLYSNPPYIKSEDDKVYPVMDSSFIKNIMDDYINSDEFKTKIESIVNKE